MTLVECGDCREAVVKLADAMNQIAMAVEDIAYYYAQHGYTDSTYPRRARLQSEMRAVREQIAELIPE